MPEPWKTRPEFDDLMYAAGYRDGYNVGKGNVLDDIDNNRLPTYSRFQPDLETARQLVVAANQRAERIAQRLLEATKYAHAKGDLELVARLAVPELANAALSKEGER